MINNFFGLGRHFVDLLQNIFEIGVTPHPRKHGGRLCKKLTSTSFYDIFVNLSKNVSISSQNAIFQIKFLFGKIVRFIRKDFANNKNQNITPYPAITTYLLTYSVTGIFYTDGGIFPN